MIGINIGVHYQEWEPDEPVPCSTCGELSAKVYVMMMQIGDAENASIESFNYRLCEHCYNTLDKE